MSIEVGGIWVLLNRDDEVGYYTIRLRLRYCLFGPVGKSICVGLLSFQKNLYLNVFVLNHLLSVTVTL